MRALGVRDWLRFERGVDPLVWIGLLMAMTAVVTTGGPHGDLRLTTLGAIVVVLGLATRWRVAPLAILVLLVSGIVLRLAFQSHTASDVLDVVVAGIRQAAAGQNPYGIGYAVSRPPGAPFAYGPLALLWYWPVLDHPWALELVGACAVLAALALRGKVVGLAIYALAPTLITTAADGTNDTSAGVILLAAFVLAGRRPVAGAVLLAAAVAFKPYAAAWVPAFALWGGWLALLAFAVASLLLWAPVLFVWGIPSFLESLDLANKVHANPGWSFGQLWQTVLHRPAPRDLLDNLRLVLGSLAALATLRWAKSLDGVILAGTVVYVVTLFMGFWATFGYFAAIAPLLCWRIDDWLRVALGTGPREPAAAGSSAASGSSSRAVAGGGVT